MSERVQIRDASIRLDSMPTDGRELVLSVDAEDRGRIAHFLGVTAVDALDVALHAVRFRGGMRVTGRVVATVVQPSVVSLEPVTQRIAEPVDRVFLPGEEKLFAGTANAEIFVDLEGDDVPDHFEGNEADLSDLVVETLALAIDPYPRRDGESLAAPVDDDAAAEHPFARLRALKDSDKG